LFRAINVTKTIVEPVTTWVTKTVVEPVTRFVTEQVPRYVEKVVETWDYVTKEVPRYVTRQVQDGWDYVTKTVKKPSVQKALASSAAAIATVGVAALGASSNFGCDIVIGGFVFRNPLCNITGYVSLPTPTRVQLQYSTPTSDLRFTQFTPRVTTSTPSFKTPTLDPNRLPTVTPNYALTLTPQIDSGKITVPRGNWDWVAKLFGIDSHDLSDIIHACKEFIKARGDDDIGVDLDTGDLYDMRNKRKIGDVFNGC